MKLTITRHGETEENKKRIAQGHLPGKLSILGKTQAKKLAKRLEKEKFDHIFSSDLARASDTAKEISKSHKKTPLDFTEDLRERHLGDMQGKPAPLEYKEKNMDAELSKKLKLEPLEDLSKRAQKFLDELTKNHYGKHILLVAHDGINQALIASLLKKPLEDVYGFLGNTSVTIFEFDDEKNPVLKLFNDVKHLEEGK